MKSGSMPTQYFIRMAPVKMAQVDRALGTMLCLPQGQVNLQSLPICRLGRGPLPGEERPFHLGRLAQNLG